MTLCASDKCNRRGVHRGRGRLIPPGRSRAGPRQEVTADKAGRHPQEPGLAATGCKNNRTNGATAPGREAVYNEGRQRDKFLTQFNKHLVKISCGQEFKKKKKMEWGVMAHACSLSYSGG